MATVVVGEDGELVGADFLCGVYDFSLVHADEGTEDDHVGCGLGALDIFDCLTCYLADGLSGA